MAKVPGERVRITFIIISSLIVVALAGVALLAAIADKDTGYCLAEGLCVKSQHFVNLSVIMALSAIFVLALVDSGGAARGAAVVLLGLYALGGPQFISRTTAPPQTNSSQDDDEEVLLTEVFAAADSASLLEMGANQEFVGDIALTEGGVAARYFDLEARTTIRIDVEDAQDYSSSDISVEDPFVFLLKKDDVQEYVIVGANDDGGQDLNARLEMLLEPGRYFIVVRNIGQNNLSPVAMSFVLKVVEKSLESIPDEQTMLLSATQDEADRVFRYSGAVQDVNTATDFLIEVQQADTQTCLFVDVNPLGRKETSARYRDTKIKLRNEVGAVLAENDDRDRSSDDLGSRVAWRVPAGEAGISKMYHLEVGAFADNTTFDLFVEVKQSQNDTCKPADEYRRPE